MHTRTDTNTLSSSCAVGQLTQSQWPQYQPPPPTRWPPHWGHSQRPSSMEWSPARSRYHTRLTTHSRRPAPTPSRKVRRSRFAGCPQKQRKNLPRTPQQPTLPIGGACNRGWGQVERRGRSVCQQLSTSQSATGTRHPPTQRCSRSHCTLDSHPDTCSHDPLCSHPSRLPPLS